MTSTTSPTERVGRYQLLEPIGIGPSGAVSRAKVFGVAGFERQFAVKRFHTELTATAAMAAMLSAAARAYGSLEHPRIARMSEFGVAQGSTFTAVEYVPGLDALRLISEARLAGVTLAAGGALALVSQAARAVGYAHGRGLTHLGLAPTNVIVTADGDIKITDFGILSATLPQRPIEMSRLAQRIPYLAPEQLANEAPSAATDVFALGVLAYELITGNRAFKGDTPQQVASAIMAGPPGEPSLPRPIVRVLSRCLARSPFERFPDARALADALDAALRVAPVPGTRKDIGAQVKETLDRLAALNEGQLSGVVALHLGTGPVRRLDDDVRRRAPTHGRDAETTHAPGGPATSGGAVTVGGPMISGGAVTVGGPMTSGGPPTIGGPATIGGPMTSGGAVTVGGPMTSGGPATIGGPMTSGGAVTVGGPMTSGGPATTGGPPAFDSPAATLHDLPRYPITTVPGLPPPPIPVPAGVGLPATPPPTAPTGASTLLGVGKSPPGIPTIKPRPGSAAGSPSSRPPAVPAAALRATTRPGTDLGIAIEPASASAQLEAANDGPIHTLDPNDVESIDSGLVNIVELDSLADDASIETSEVSGAASPRSSRPFDRSEIETKPIPKVTLEPLLFDPIDERSEPEAKAADFTDAETFDDDDDFEAREAPSSARARATPTGTPIASSQTIVGFAAPLPLPRAATPSPHAQISPVAADPDASTEEAAGTPREGSHTAPDPTSSSTPPIPPSLQREAAEVHPPESPPPAKTPPPAKAPPMPPGWVTTPPSPADTPTTPSAQRPRRRLTWIVIGIIGAAIAGVGAWQAYLRVVTAPAMPGGGVGVAKVPSDAQPAGTPVDAAQVAVASPADAAQVAVAPPADAAQVAVAPPADAAQVAVAPPADAAQVAVAPDAARIATGTVDAGTPPSDAAQVAAVKPSVPTATGDMLSIASTPPGARVFLDGSDSGATPLKLPGSPDHHTIALLLAGHELYVAQVDGHGAFQIPLKEVTPANGPAGIKVLRCKDKDRYYVFVDGKPTGQTCPTERIGCEVGPHTVEVYDVVSETRRKWDIVVKDDRLSFRVRVE